MRISKFTCTFLTLLSPAWTHPANSVDTCAAVKYIVLDSHDIAPYNEAVHGNSPTNRIFNKLPNASCYKKTQPVELSNRTDLQLRDQRTSLMLYERGFLSWASSLLAFTPFAFLSAALSLAECGYAIYKASGDPENDWTSPAMCMASLCLLALGTVFPTWQSISDTLGGAAANVLGSISESPDAFATGGGTINDYISLTTFVKKRGLDLSDLEAMEVILNTQIPLYHADSDKQARVWHLFAANETHPIHVYPFGVIPNLQNSTVRMWSEHTNNTRTPFRFHNMMKIPYNNSASTKNSTNVKRCVVEGQDEVCTGEGDSSQLVPGAPDQAYFGYDLYGPEWAINEWEDDMGTTYDATNGFPTTMQALGQDIYDSNAWDTCICMQTSGTWIATGSLQLSWDDTYNGFSECWNSDCDGA